jgi:hypothetical protein
LDRREKVIRRYGSASALTTRRSLEAVDANISWAGGVTLAVALNNDTAAFA